ncbi:MAG: hypothetical protein V1646_04200 [bacterium]
MKKLVFISLSIFLVFSHSQNLNLNSLKAEPVSCIENNPNLAAFLNACQNNSKFAQEKMTKVVKIIKNKLLCMCNLSEKLELREFTKTPTLFEKLFSEFIRNVAGLLDIEHEKIKTFTKNMQLPNSNTTSPNKELKSPNLQCVCETEAEVLVNEILNISEDKLTISISLVTSFLNPSTKEQVGTEQIKHVLTQTFSKFSLEELNAIRKVINSRAFKKITNNLDVLTEMVLSIIKEEDVNSTVK